MSVYSSLMYLVGSKCSVLVAVIPVLFTFIDISTVKINWEFRYYHENGVYTLLSIVKSFSLVYLTFCFVWIIIRYTTVELWVTSMWDPVNNLYASGESVSVSVSWTAEILSLFWFSASDFSTIGFGEVMTWVRCYKPQLHIRPLHPSQLL